VAARNGRFLALDQAGIEIGREQALLATRCGAVDELDATLFFAIRFEGRFFAGSSAGLVLRSRRNSRRRGPTSHISRDKSRPERNDSPEHHMRSFHRFVPENSLATLRWLARERGDVHDSHALDGPVRRARPLWQAMSERITRPEIPGTPTTSSVLLADIQGRRARTVVWSVLALGLLAIAVYLLVT
jgi:hypothetical protein